MGLTTQDEDKTRSAGLSQIQKELYFKNLSKEQKNFRRIRTGNRGTLRRGRRNKKSA